MSSEVVITVRHGARLDINAKDDQEIEDCGGRHEFDTPLCFHGHEQAHQTGLFLADVIKNLKDKRPIEVKLWSSPYLRCLQTGCGVFNALNELLGETKPKVINITEYLAEAQMSGYYNDTARMDDLFINRSIKTDPQLQNFMQERIYKFLKKQTAKFDISYEVRHKGLSPNDCELYHEFSEFTFDYPEGGKGAPFPENVNVQNLRYHQFYHKFIEKSPDDIDQDKLTIHLCATHGNCCKETVLAFYDQMYQYVAKKKSYDLFKHPLAQYSLLGIGYCSVSVHGRLSAAGQAL